MKRPRILLLDDDTRAVEAATALLEAGGFDVLISGRRHGRLDFIAKQQPDLLLVVLPVSTTEETEDRFCAGAPVSSQDLT